MDCKIYSIGYICFEQEQMLSIMKELSIHCLIDVRSVPMSSYAPQYNQPVFSEFLQNNHIYYKNYSEFGARQDNTEYFTADGYLDFNKYIASNQFLEGMKKIKKGIDQNYKFVFMCAEKDPVNCHRAIMVSKAFSKENYKIYHIKPGNNGKIFCLESHTELERRLCTLNNDDLSQGSLIETDQQRIENAYKAMNRKIGYRLSDKNFMG